MNGLDKLSASEKDEIRKQIGNKAANKLFKKPKSKETKVDFETIFWVAFLAFCIISFLIKNH